MGARIQDENQKSDVEFNFKGIKGYNNLDYISIWFYKGAKYIDGINARLAFVSTNSICQGEQVCLFWPRILDKNIEIDFAHTSFKWLNNAKGNAGVTVIIIGLRNISTRPKYLFNEKIRKESKNINAYLLDSNNIYIIPRTSSISKLPEMKFGNMANDGGNLFLDTVEKNNFIDENPKSEKFIKKLVGSLEFLRGVDKYCLWINEENVDEAMTINLIKERVNLTKKSRLESKRVATQKLAKIPYSFAEVRFRETESIIVPSVSSEKREYIPMGFLNKDSIIVAPNMAIYDAQPWLFGILHSKMHMVWVDAVGGKLKTDYRYSAKLCYNTFPFPETSIKQKENINYYVFAILDERAKFPQKTMAWLYNPETMPKDLLKAHQELDQAIERIYRIQPFTSDAERLEYLFKMYDEMTKKDTLWAKEKKTKAKKKV